jgi:hypothetical protein
MNAGISGCGRCRVWVLSYSTWGTEEDHEMPVRLTRSGQNLERVPFDWMSGKQCCNLLDRCCCVPAHHLISLMPGSPTTLEHKNPRSKYVIGLPAETARSCVVIVCGLTSYRGRNFKPSLRSENERVMWRPHPSAYDQVPAAKRSVRFSWNLM